MKIQHERVGELERTEMRLSVAERIWDWVAGPKAIATPKEVTATGAGWREKINSSSSANAAIDAIRDKKCLNAIVCNRNEKGVTCTALMKTGRLIEVRDSLFFSSDKVVLSIEIEKWTGEADARREAVRIERVEDKFGPPHTQVRRLKLAARAARWHVATYGAAPMTKSFAFERTPQMPNLAAKIKAAN